MAGIVLTQLETTLRFSIGNYKSTRKQQVISDTGTSWLGAPKAATSGIVKAIGAKFNYKYQIVGDISRIPLLRFFM